MGGHKSNNSSAQVLASIQIQTSAYGGPLAIVYGTTRIPGNLVDYDDFQSHGTTQKVGKGGGGGGSTSYTYTAGVILALCEGPVQGVGQVWLDKALGSLSGYGFSFFVGTRSQAPWSVWQTNHPAKAVPYAGMAYVCNPSLTLDSSGNVGNYNFEVTGFFATVQDPAFPLAFDALPSDIIRDFLSNAYYGAGWDPARIGDLVTGAASYATYCQACGFVLSPAMDTQRTAAEWLQDILTATNSEAIWSTGPLGMLLKIVPYGDQPISANGTTYTPNTTPLYDLGYDDFLGVIDSTGAHTGNDPITITRTSPEDIKNTVPVEILDRSLLYNANTLQVPEPMDSTLNGMNVDSSQSLHMITRAAMGQAISLILGQKNVYIRNQYSFNLGWKYLLLEQMDLVTLTDPILGLVKKVVRIVSITLPAEGSEENGLAIVAEEWPFGTGTAALFNNQVAAGTAPNVNADPGNANMPDVFTPPVLLTGGVPQLWMAASGGPLWGGANVYVSVDGGSSYSLVGTVTNKSRHGGLTAALPTSATASDTTSTLAVDLSECAGSLASVAAQELQDLLTLCWVDGEMLAFQTATLTGPNAYGLTLLQRGAYGSPIKAHAAGARFVRVDNNIFEYAVPAARQASPIFIKLQSFNLWGGGTQNLATVPAYSCQLDGSVTLGYVISNFTTVYAAGQSLLQWDAIQQPGMLYEIRMGTSWAAAKILGRIPDVTFQTVSDGTYWVAAYYNGNYGTPASLLVAGTTLVANVVATSDEATTGWAGAISGGAAVDRTLGLFLDGASLIDSLTTTLMDSIVGFWDSMGGVLSSGSYEVPASHDVDIGNAQVCTVSTTYAFAASMVSSLWDTFAGNVDSLTFLMDGQAAGIVDAQPWIAIAGQNGVFGAYQKFIPGQYFGRIFKMKMVLTSSDASITPLVVDWSWTVDVPDRIANGNAVVCPAVGLPVVYATPFQIKPNLQITILNKTQGDDEVVTGDSRSGFTVQCFNAGVAVARTINWIAQAY